MVTKIPNIFPKSKAKAQPKINTQPATYVDSKQVGYTNSNKITTVTPLFVNGSSVKMYRHTAGTPAPNGDTLHKGVRDTVSDYFTQDKDILVSQITLDYTGFWIDPGVNCTVYDAAIQFLINNEVVYQFPLNGVYTNGVAYVLQNYAKVDLPESILLKQNQLIEIKAYILQGTNNSQFSFTANMHIVGVSL